MADRPNPGGFKAGYVEARFEEAGKTLLALPWAGCFPAGLRTLWPETSASDVQRRYPIPSSQAISEMDEAYRWVGLVKDMEERRLVLMRSLVFPDSPKDRPRYVWSWRRLRSTTGLHTDTLQGRWGRGIDRIVAALNRPGFCVASGGPFGIPRNQMFARRPERATA